MGITRLALYGGMRGGYQPFAAQPPQIPTETPSVTGIKIMMTLNNNEYGTVLYAGLNQDISAASDYVFKLQPNLGNIQEKVGILGIVDVTVDDTKFLANQYLTYTLLDGDLDQSGLWRIKGEATESASKVIYGDYSHITVLD